MAAKTTLPFKSVMPFGQSPIHTVSEKYHYACFGLNTGNSDSKYDFSESEFKLTCTTCTGYKDGDTFWVLATVPQDEALKTYPFEIKQNNGGKWEVNKEKTDKALEQWRSSSCLIAINTKDIPVLSWFAEVLVELKILVKGTFRVNLALTSTNKETLQSSLKTILNYLINSDVMMPKPEQTNEFTALGVTNKFMGIPIPIIRDIPKIDELHPEYGIPTGNKIIASVPFNGEFPNIENFIFSAPDVKTSGGGSTRSYGTSVNVEGYSSDKAWAWIKSNYDDVASFFHARFPNISGTSLIEMALAISGVQVMPTIYMDGSIQPPKLITASSEPTINNGHPVSSIEALPIVKELSEIKEEIEAKSNPPQERVTRWFTENGMQADSWLKMHTEPVDLINLLTVVESNTYKLSKSDVENWVAARLGISGMKIPVTALPKSEDLAELAKQCISNDIKLQIDPTATII